MSQELPQVKQVRAWLEADLHPDHDTFAMGREFAQALIDEIDQLRGVLVFADGYAVQSNRRTERYTVALADLYNDTTPLAAVIQRAGCHPRGSFAEENKGGHDRLPDNRCSCGSADFNACVEKVLHG